MSWGLKERDFKAVSLKNNKRSQDLAKHLSTKFVGFYGFNI